jgi:hypothetical protein
MIEVAGVPEAHRPASSGAAIVYVDAVTGESRVVARG